MCTGFGVRGCKTYQLRGTLEEFRRGVNSNLYCRRIKKFSTCSAKSAKRGKRGIFAKNSVFIHKIVPKAQKFCLFGQKYFKHEWFSIKFNFFIVAKGGGVGWGGVSGCFEIFGQRWWVGLGGGVWGGLKPLEGSCSDW